MACGSYVQEETRGEMDGWRRLTTKILWFDFLHVHCFTDPAEHLIMIVVIYVKHIAFSLSLSHLLSL